MTAAMHCVVCHGEIKGGHGWQVAGRPSRFAHPDCHRLAFSTDPVQRCCDVCGRSLVGPLVLMGPARLGMTRRHATCAINSAPSWKAPVRTN